MKRNNLFECGSFVGYVKAVNAKEVRLYFPSSTFMREFSLNGSYFPGASIENMLLIEGGAYGYVARLTEIYIPDSERRSLSGKSLQGQGAEVHPLGVAELLFSFDLTTPYQICRSAASFPSIGDRVYSCSIDYLGGLISKSGIYNNEGVPRIALGKSLNAKLPLSFSVNSLFCRHCAILGTTGGGKSWTMARLLGEFYDKTKNKVLVLDATGEYSQLPGKHVALGRDIHIEYSKLSNSEFCFLLAEDSPNTTAILCNAIDSLKLSQIKGSTDVLIKSGKKVCEVQKLIAENCHKLYQVNFDLMALPSQIRNECVKETKAGSYESCDFRIAYSSGLIARTESLIRNRAFSDLFGLQKREDPKHDLLECIDDFLKCEENRLLCIDFSRLSYEYNARELAVELIARTVLTHARNMDFKDSPLLFAVDEAHQFLNKSSVYENTKAFSMTGVNTIAKEGRKYGLFLCVATQMPRDVPVDVMSQMGTFIIHRLVNDSDRMVVSKSCSSCGSVMLNYLPMLGQGEALVSGIDFPLPLLVKITEPAHKPESNTPSFHSR